MKKFVGFMTTTTGRAIRIFAGLALILIGYSLGTPVGYAIGTFGFLPALTGLFDLCPVGPFFGFKIKGCAICDSE